MKKIINQLIKEFWIPLLISIIWTLINIYLIFDDNEANLKTNAINYVNIFGPTFFLVSWLTGQIFRVKKQMNVEHNLNKVENKLISITEQLENKTNQLINFTTGGDSYFYYKVTNNIPDKESFYFTIEGQYVGEYPLCNVRILFLMQDVKANNFSLEERNINSNTISRINRQIKFDFSSNNYYTTSIVFHASNQSWIQLIRVFKIKEKIHVSSETHINDTVRNKEDYQIELFQTKEELNYKSLII